MLLTMTTKTSLIMSMMMSIIIINESAPHNDNEDISHNVNDDVHHYHK